jgi:GT2 family glycosyltransferase
MGSLRSQTCPPHEVIVVDASDEATFRKNEIALAQLETATKAEHVQAEPGLTRQRNIGVERAVEAVILFLDDDVVLSPTYVQDIVEGFERYPHALGLTGSILLERPPNRVAGRLRRLAGFRDFRSGDPTWLGEVGYVMKPAHDLPLHVLPGCNMAFRREVFDILELKFDESLPGYALAEDYIFSSQVRRFGPLLQLTAPKLFHNASSESCSPRKADA